MEVEPIQVIPYQALPAVGSKLTFAWPVDAKKVIVTEIEFIANDSGAYTLTIEYTPLGGSLCKPYDEVAVDVAGSLPLPSKKAWVLYPGDILSAYAGTASKVLCRIDGVKVI